MNSTAAENTTVRNGWIRWAILGLIVTGLVLAGFVLPLKEYYETLFQWIQENRLLGAVALGAIYIVLTVLFVPGSIPTLASGFLFGPIWGTVLVSIASVLGATGAFLTGRFIARDWVARNFAKGRRFQAIDHAVGRQGFKIVLLTRLSPIFPFNVLNYLFGLTRVRVGDYMLASWIGMFPGTLMYVYFGSTLKNVAAVLAGKYEGGLLQTSFFVIGLVVAVVVTLYVTRLATRALKEHVPAAGDEQADDDDGRDEAPSTT